MTSQNISGIKGIASIVIPTDKWFDPTATVWNQMREDGKNFIHWIRHLSRLFYVNPLKKVENEKKRPRGSNEPPDVQAETLDEDESDVIDDEKTIKTRPMYYMQVIDNGTKTPYYMIHILSKSVKAGVNNPELKNGIKMFISDLGRTSGSVTKKIRLEMDISGKKGIEGSNFKNKAFAMSVIKFYTKLLYPETLKSMGMYDFSINESIDPGCIEKMISPNFALEVLRKFGVRTRHVEAFFNGIDGMINGEEESVLVGPDFIRLPSLDIMSKNIMLPHADEVMYKINKVFNLCKFVPLAEGEISRIMKEDVIPDRMSLLTKDSKKKFNDIFGLVSNWNREDYKKLTWTYTRCKTTDDLYEKYKDDYEKFTKRSAEFALKIFTGNVSEDILPFYPESLSALVKWTTTTRMDKDGKIHLFMSENSDGTLTPQKFPRFEEGLCGVSNFLIYALKYVNNIEYSSARNNNIIALCIIIFCGIMEPSGGERLNLHLKGVHAASKSYMFNLLGSLLIEGMVTKLDDLGSDQAFSPSMTPVNYSAYVFDDLGLPSFKTPKGQTVINNLKTRMTTNTSRRRIMQIDDQTKQRHTFDLEMDTKFYMLIASNEKIRHKPLEDRFICDDVTPHDERNHTNELKYAKDQQKSISSSTDIEARRIFSDMQCGSNMLLATDGLSAKIAPDIETAQNVLNKLVYTIGKSGMPFKFETRDYPRLVLVTKILGAMNANTESMLIDDAPNKGKAFDEEVLIETSKYQFSTIEHSVLAMSILYNTYQDKIFKSMIHAIFNEIWNLPARVENMVKTLFRQPYVFEKHGLNYDYHLLSMLERSNGFEMKTNMVNGRETYDPNYCSWYVTVNKACSEIYAKTSSKYLHTEVDMQFKLKKSTYRMTPAKVYKYITKQSFNGTKEVIKMERETYCAAVERYLKEHEMTQKTPKQVDEAITDVFSALSKFELCNVGDPFFENCSHIYNGSLPVFTIETLQGGEDKYRINILLEAARLNPEKILIDAVKDLSQFVSEPKKVLLLFNERKEIVTIKPNEREEPYGINYRLKMKNIEDDEILSKVHPHLDEERRSFMNYEESSEERELSNLGSLNINELTKSAQYVNQLMGNTWDRKGIPKIEMRDGIDKFFGEIHLQKHMQMGDLDKYFK